MAVKGLKVEICRANTTCSLDSLPNDILDKVR